MCYTLSVWPKPTAKLASLCSGSLPELRQSLWVIEMEVWLWRLRYSWKRSKPLKGAHTCGRKLSEYPNPLSKCPHIQSFSELLEEICIFSWGFHILSSDEKLPWVDLYLAVPQQDTVLCQGRLTYILSVSGCCICIRDGLIDRIWWLSIPDRKKISALPFQYRWQQETTPKGISCAYNLVW